jgi:hypothetical protein
MKKSWKERFAEAYKENQAAHEKRLDPNQTDPEEAKRYYRKAGFLIILIGFLPAAAVIGLYYWDNGRLYIGLGGVTIACWIIGFMQLITGKPKR